MSATTDVRSLTTQLEGMGVSFSGQGRYTKYSFGTAKAPFKTPIFEGQYFDAVEGNVRGLGSRQPTVLLGMAGYINRQKAGLSFEAVDIIHKFLHHIYHG